MKFKKQIIFILIFFILIPYLFAANSAFDARMISLNFNITFNAEQAKLPDASTLLNIGPCVISSSISQTVASLNCDDSTEEGAIFSTVLAPYNGGNLYADVYFTMASATSGNIIDRINVMCVTTGDSTDLDSHSFDSANSSTTSVPGTAGYMKVNTITLTNKDSCAAGDLMIIFYSRNAASGSDTATGDEEVRRIRIYEA